MPKKDIKPSDIREDMKKLVQKGLTYHQIADKLGFDTLADGFRPLFYELNDQHKKGVLLGSVDSLIKEGTKTKPEGTKTEEGTKKKPRGTKNKTDLEESAEGTKTKADLEDSTEGTKTKPDLEESTDNTKKKQRGTKAEEGTKKKPKGTKIGVGSVLKEETEEHSVQDEFKSLVNAEKAKQKNKEPELEDINLDDIKLVGDTTLVLDGDTKANKKDYSALLIKLDEIIMLEIELEIIQSKLKTRIKELKKEIKNA